MKNEIRENFRSYTIELDNYNYCRSTLRKMFGYVLVKYDPNNLGCDLLEVYCLRQFAPEKRKSYIRNNMPINKVEKWLVASRMHTGLSMDNIHAIITDLKRIKVGAY